MTFGLSGAALAGIAVGGATLVSGLAQSNAASSAAATQAGSAQSGIDEQRRQFDAVQKLLAPYVQAGGQGLAGYSPYQEAGAVHCQHSNNTHRLAPQHLSSSRP